MKKVLFMIHDLGPGGAEKVLVNLVNNIDKSKFKVTVLALFGGGVNEQFINQNEVKLITCHKKMIRGNSHFMKLFSPKRLYDFYVKDEYDIVVSYLEGPCARIISGCTNKKTKKVAWIHIQQHNLKRSSVSFRSTSEAVECYEKFEQIIGVSEYVCQSFEKVFKLSKPTKVLYNTVDSSYIRKKSKENINDVKFCESEIKICAVGKLLKSKGFDRLVNIQRRLQKEGYNTHFYFLGEGPLRKELEENIKQYGLSDHISLLGYQKNPYKYIKQCDMFVCASLQEGFSTATTEALILGVPVVTTEVSGMKEMLGDNNEFGLVVGNSEDALYAGIKKLLDDKELLDFYTVQAGKRGEKFDLVETIREVERMLIQL